MRGLHPKAQHGRLKQKSTKKVASARLDQCSVMLARMLKCWIKQYRKTACANTTEICKCRALGARYESPGRASDIIGLPSASRPLWGLICATETLNCLIRSLAIRSQHFDEAAAPLARVPGEGQEDGIVKRLRQ